MRKLVVTEFISLDGVMEDPGGAEGFERGGWAFQFERGPDGDRFKLEELMAADILLLGRVTYEGFAAAWPSMTDEEGFADKMNSMEKVVVSTTLEEASWNNSRIVRDDVAGEVARLRAADGGDILVAGSRTLAQALAEHDLVDEYRLMVFPVVLGGGRRLFGGAARAVRLRLEEAQPVGGGVMTLVYTPIRD